MDALRERVESDLQTTLEGDYGMVASLVTPTGNIITKSANDPDSDLMGQVMYDTVIQNLDTGLEQVSNKPILTLRRSSLSEVPSDTDYKTWIVKIPSSPISGASIEEYSIIRPPEGGRSHGFIRLYLGRIIQSS